MSVVLRQNPFGNAHLSSFFLFRIEYHLASRVERSTGARPGVCFVVSLFHKSIALLSTQNSKLPLPPCRRTWSSNLQPRLVKPMDSLRWVINFNSVKTLSNRQHSQRAFWCFYTAAEQHFHLICDLWSITNKRRFPCVNQELIHKTRHTSSPKISIVVGKILPQTFSFFLSFVRNHHFISWELVLVKIIGIFHYNHDDFHSNECFE